MEGCSPLHNRTGDLFNYRVPGIEPIGDKRFQSQTFYIMVYDNYLYIQSAINHHCKYKLLKMEIHDGYPNFEVCCEYSFCLTLLPIACFEACTLERLG